MVVVTTERVAAPIAACVVARPSIVSPPGRAVLRCRADTDKVPDPNAAASGGGGRGSSVAPKDKDRLELVDIIDIKAGQVSGPLMRTGSKVSDRSTH